MERKRREREALAQSERSRLKRATAKHVMSLWNSALAAGWRTIFYPTVGTALVTGCNFLHVVCPACQQMGETDLRKINVPRDVVMWAAAGVILALIATDRASPFLYFQF